VTFIEAPLPWFPPNGLSIDWIAHFIDHIGFINTTIPLTTE
jgi:hypothetical protein